MELSPAAELLEIAQALRAHLESQKLSGTTGLPAAPRSAFEPAVPLEAPVAPEARTLPAALEARTPPVAPEARTPPVAPEARTPPAAPEARTPEARRVPEARMAPPAMQRDQPARPAAAPPGVARPAAASAISASAVPQAPVAVAPSARIAASEPAQPRDPAEREHRLRLLATTVAGCTRCGLASTRTQTVFARGTGSSGLCFVGEGPGADEDAQGYPFVGVAGQLLDRMIGAMGLEREEVYVCNIVKCRPPQNRKPEQEEMAACMPYLAEQLELLEPQVIVALGATAVQGLLGTTEGIMRLRGKWKLYRGRIAVMPTFHPAYLLRTPAAKREVWEDLQAVLRQLGRTLPTKPR